MSAPAQLSREENVYMAKLAEQAKRYEEMVEFMEKVANTVDSEELTVEERNLQFVAYKNVIGARRVSWRIISSVEQKEESHGNEDRVTLIKDYRGKIETELTKICDGILKLLDTHLVPSSTAPESKLFYLKMKGTLPRLELRGRMLLRIPWWHTRLLRILLWLRCLQLTRLGLGWHLTSQCSIMRSSTHLIVLAITQSKLCRIFQAHKREKIRGVR